MKFTNIMVRLVVLVVSIFIITFGTSLCIRTDLGCSPVSVPPYVWSLAGGMTIGGFHVPAWTIGTYTFILNAIFVVFQIILLRRKYHPIQLLQLGIGFVFGFFLDISMALTSIFQWSNIVVRLIQLLIGGLIMAFGLSLEVLARLVVKPGDGLILAITQIADTDFGKVKIFYDSSLVLLGTICMLIFFRSWHWNMVGIGTLISMVYVGYCVRLLRPLTAKIEHLIYR